MSFGGNAEDRILVPSDFPRPRFISTIQDLVTLGIKLAVCLQNLQLCGTEFYFEFPFTL